MLVTEEQVFQCCSSAVFAHKLSSWGEFSAFEELVERARGIWWHQVSSAGWLEAFSAHPRIGDTQGLKSKVCGFAAMSKSEQSGAAQASSDVVQRLLEWNRRYEEKFDHIFIICASGKGALFMLEALQSRYTNTPFQELGLAAAEQMKITEIRLAQVVGHSPSSSPAELVGSRTGQMRAHLEGKQLTSPITSHVLDTARGRPAEGVEIMLDRQAAGSNDIWEPVASARTNSDGRVPNLLPPAQTVSPGIYRVTFGMSDYMRTCKSLHPDFFPDKPFYPSAAVQFEITQSQISQHFHIPLTWNPYGYSTYRGS